MVVWGGKALVEHVVAQVLDEPGRWKRSNLLDSSGVFVVERGALVAPGDDPGVVDQRSDRRDHVVKWLQGVLTYGFMLFGRRADEHSEDP